MRRLFLAFLGLAVVHAAQAAPQDDPAKLAYERGDYTRARQLLLPRAARNDAAAQVMLATIYFRGLRTVPNADLAAQWLKDAAESGDAQAQSSYGYLFLMGSGVQKDGKIALEWFTKAAEQNHPAALYYLAQIHEDGLVVPRDFKKAVELYRRAAEMGERHAQRELGLLMMNGALGPKDPAGGAALILKAAEQNDQDSQCRVAHFYDEGLGFPQSMLDAGVWFSICLEGYDYPSRKADFELAARIPKVNADSAYKAEFVKRIRSLELKMLVAERPADLLLVGTANGDIPGAVSALRALADGGDPWAQTEMALVYDTGITVPRDSAEAVRWYQAAAAKRYGPAEEALARWYEEGKGVPRDLAVSREWLVKAAEDGERTAQYKLGRLYVTGDGMPKDDSAAHQWFLKAAEQGEAGAQLAVARQFLKGEGAPVNMESAERWMRAAARQNVPVAAYGMTVIFGEKNDISKLESFRKNPEILTFLFIAAESDDPTFGPKAKAAAAKISSQMNEQQQAVMKLDVLRFKHGAQYRKNHLIARYAFPPGN